MWWAEVPAFGPRGTCSLDGLTVSCFRSCFRFNSCTSF